MKAVFISDAHLVRQTDERYVRLILFLDDILAGALPAPDGCVRQSGKKKRIDALYILGDFFDFWFCNNNRIYPDFQPVIARLVELQKNGTRIHWCEGNHDFYLKEYFQNKLGMTVSEEWDVIFLDSLRIFIAHGDTVDQANRRYLALRKVLRSSLFFHFQRLLPASLRWALAGASSNASKQMNDRHDALLVEKMHRFADKKLQEDYDAVIFGHCHNPLLRQVTVKDKSKTAVTLGDWSIRYSYLYYENEKFFLLDYAPMQACQSK